MTERRAATMRGHRWAAASASVALALTLGSAATAGAPAAAAVSETAGLTVRVVDRETLEPVAGATVTLTEEGSTAVAFRGESAGDGTVSVVGRTSRSQVGAGEILLGPHYQVAVLDAGDHAHDYWPYDERWEVPTWSTTGTVLEAHVVRYEDPEPRFGVEECGGPDVTVYYSESSPSSWDLGAPVRLDGYRDTGTVTVALDPVDGTPWHAERGFTAAFTTPGRVEYPGRRAIVLQDGDEVVVGRRIMGDRTLVSRFTVHCPPRGFASTRAAVADGRLFVAVAGLDGSVAVRARSAATDTWSGWASLGTPPSPATTTAVPLTSDGYLFVTTVGEDGRLYYRTRNDATNAWSQGWTDRGAPQGVHLVGAPAGIESDGYLFLTVLGDDGRLWTRSRNARTNAWSGWIDRGRPAGVTLVHSVAPVRSDGYLFLTVLGDDGRLWTRSRSESSNSWSGWIDRGAPAGAHLVGKPTPVVSDGSLFIVALSDDGGLWTRSRNEASNSWSGWIFRGRSGWFGRSVGGVGAARSDGYLWIATTNHAGALFARARNESLHEWASWHSKGTPSGVPDVVDAPTVVRFDGALWMVSMSDAGSLYALSRDERTNAWTDWVSLGHPSGTAIAG